MLFGTFLYVHTDALHTQGMLTFCHAAFTFAQNVPSYSRLIEIVNTWLLLCARDRPFCQELNVAFTLFLFGLLAFVFPLGT
jgi:hypothetical protein